MLQKIDSKARSYKHMILNTFIEDITEGTLYLATFESSFPISGTKGTSFAVSQGQKQY